jgi:hypothetical protein
MLQVTIARAELIVGGQSSVSFEPVPVSAWQETRLYHQAEHAGSRYIGVAIVDGHVEQTLDYSGVNNNVRRRRTSCTYQISWMVAGWVSMPSQDRCYWEQGVDAR